MRWLDLHASEAIDRAVAAYIARQQAGAPTCAPIVPPPPRPLSSPIDAARILRARRARRRFLPPDLFGEPAWDMLLDLREQARRDADVSVSSLCVAAAVPPTTALRCIGFMVDAGVIERTPDRDDRRRSHVRLAPATADGLDRYFAWLESY